MKTKTLTRKLKKMNACDEAIDVIAKYDTAQEAWDNCKRGDWMLWLVGRLSNKPESIRRRQLVLTTCKCARLALKHVRKGDNRPLETIEVAEKWARREKWVTIKDVRAAADATYAADAAADAADAADAAADAAYAAYAADAAADAVADAAYAAGGKTLAKCADIVRKDYPDIDKLFR